jgi:hypothetical protein
VYSRFDLASQVFNDDLHAQFDHHPHSVCGMVFQNCNVSAVETNMLNWWYETCGKIKRTLIGNLPTFTSKQCIYVFVVSDFNGLVLNNTFMYLCCLSRWRTWQDKWLPKNDRTYILQMRQNRVHYISLIDVIALCIVSSSVWNNDALMAEYCGNNEHNLQEHVLTISDEAFLLLILVDYAPCWSAEVQLENKMVKELCGCCF